MTINWRCRCCNSWLTFISLAVAASNWIFGKWYQKWHACEELLFQRFMSKWVTLLLPCRSFVCILKSVHSCSGWIQSEELFQLCACSSRGRKQKKVLLQFCQFHDLFGLSENLCRADSVLHLNYENIAWRAGKKTCKCRAFLHLMDV